MRGLEAVVICFSKLDYALCGIPQHPGCEMVGLSPRLAHCSHSHRTSQSGRAPQLADQIHALGRRGPITELIRYLLRNEIQDPLTHHPADPVLENSLEILNPGLRRGLEVLFFFTVPVGFKRLFKNGRCWDTVRSTSTLLF